MGKIKTQQREKLLVEMKKKGIDPFEDDKDYQPQEFLRKALLAFQ